MNLKLGQLFVPSVPFPAHAFLLDRIHFEVGWCPYHSTGIPAWLHKVAPSGSIPPMLWVTAKDILIDYCVLILSQFTVSLWKFPLLPHPHQPQISIHSHGHLAIPLYPLPPISKVVVKVCIPNSNWGVFPFLRILARMCYLLSFWSYPFCWV